MQVVFYGSNAAYFLSGFEEMCEVPFSVTAVADDDRSPHAQAAFGSADVVVGVHWQDASLEAPRLRLYQVAAAGVERVDPALLPATAAIANCFGHEPPIAEYAFLAALRHIHPVDTADRLLRQGEWRWCAQVAGEIRGELTGRTIGLLGFGHIGREIARKARAFDLKVVACNRSPVVTGDLVDSYVPLAERERFYAMCDVIVVSLPDLPETTGFVDEAAFRAMKRSAFLINVGRGPTVDEQALFDALKAKRIAGAAIDTWYVYPTLEQPRTAPGRLPFHELDNLLMTPHLSGWTDGTIRRRAEVIARNVERLTRGQPLLNVVKSGG